jgi:hypothetical protein
MTALQHLEIRNHPRPRRGVPRLSPLITDAGLAPLTGLTQLRTLRLSGIPFTAAALPHLQSIPGLTRLEISGCGLKDEDARALRKSRPGMAVACW